MADTKITALAPIGAIDPANDVLPIVDVSNNSMAASGTTCRVTTNQLLQANAIASLASATITGDLTVDTSTLKVDSANDRVGIGTATPAYPLQVAGRISYSTGIGEGADLTVSSSGTSLQFGLGSAWAQQLWYLAGAEAMRLNATGLGVGVSPSYQIHARKDQAAFTTVALDNQNAIAAGTGTQFLLIDGGVNAGWFRRNRDGSGNTDIGYKDVLRFRGQIAGTERTDMTLDTSGNVGIGVTPSAWWVGFKAFESSNGVALLAQTNVPYCHLVSNAYDGAASFKYKVSSNYALRYAQDATTGNHIWFNAGLGTAGDAITFTQAMTLDASGNLLVGTTSTHLSAHSAFQNNASGQVTFRNTSTTAGRYFNIGMNSGSSMLVVNDAGTGVYLDYGTTSWASTSDERLKDIIEPISNAVSKVGSLRSVIGKFKTDSEGTRRSFLIAQDVQAVLPEAVDTTNADAFGIRYTEVIPLLVAAIKELTAEVNALKNA